MKSAILLLLALFCGCLFLSTCRPAGEGAPRVHYATLLQAVAAHDLYGALDCLEAGGDVYARDVEGLNAFLLAAKEGQADLLRALREHGAPADAVDRAGNNALHLAAASGNVELAAVICSMGTPVNAVNDARLTPLHVAAREGHAAVAGVLLKAGANVHALSDASNAQTIPVYLAAEHQQWEVVRLLRPLGGNYGIIAAISRGDMGTVRELLEKEPTLIHETDGKRGLGLSTMQTALLYGETEIASFLKELGAPMQPYTEDGLPLLFSMADSGYRETIKWMIENGGNINITTAATGRATLVHHLAEQGNEEMLGFVLDLGAEIDRQDKNGNTALHTAAVKRQLGAARLLLERGAARDIRNAKGQLAADLAPKGGELQVLLTEGVGAGVVE